jgi:hypothetical protein
LVAALATYLSIFGLALDFAGAAFLAYDALYGPLARVQASMRRERLARVRESQERSERRLREWAAQQHTPEKSVELLRTEVMGLTQVVSETVAELRHWERHDQRVHVNAVVGMLLLMGGFACQGIAALISALSGHAVGLPV